jgi:hypothetical protein
MENQRELWRLISGGRAIVGGSRRWLNAHPIIWKWIVGLAVGVGLASAILHVVQASIEEKASDACVKDIITCENPVIQRVLRTPGDRESVARAVLAVYGEAIRSLKASGGSTNQAMAESLPNHYEVIVTQLEQGGAEPGCVRDGLAKLLAEDGLNTARTTLLSKYFDAAGEVAAILPAPREALKQYMSLAARIPEAAANIVTYEKYQLFPYDGALTCAQ